MEYKGRTVLLCNCEDTMPLDAGDIAKALGAKDRPVIHSHLCRTQTEAFELAVADGKTVLVACTQEAPLFRELAEERGSEADLGFFNIREKAGWSKDRTHMAARIAALIAEASVEVRPANLKTIRSEGVCLVYGSGQRALETAQTLSGRLAVTLLLADPGDIVPPDVADVPIMAGRIRAAKGSLGKFEITVDDYAPMMASSRDDAQFLMARDGAQSSCDLILDMSGGAPLFTGHGKREGYFRVDPESRGAVAEAMFEITDMVGEFEKPIYVDYDGDICAHARSGKVGCTNCLDACPAGAIAEDGNLVSIDPGICGGCGHCSAVCPTGAIAYNYPRRGDLIRRIQALLSTYLKAGGKSPILVLHDDTHGSALISALARHGEGLPGTALPLSLHSVGETGHDILIAALTAGAEHVVILADPRKEEENAPTIDQVALANAFLDGLGIDGGRLHLATIADPDELGRLLSGLGPRNRLKTANFDPVGGKRQVARAAIAKLAEIAGIEPERITLPAGAPYGRIAIDTEGCTLCLSCVGACPASAIADNPEKPQLRFTEIACVQCGICAATCPEQVISLEPGYDFSPAAAEQRVIVEEEPFACVRCGKPFGTKRTVERIRERLEGKHPMFLASGAASVIEMCDTCRIQEMSERPDNPFAAGEKPRIRTTNDYLEARDRTRQGLSIDDFLKDLVDDA